jgi:tRNA threonylcarbamoyladenosine biosynthesis protein TsaE
MSHMKWQIQTHSAAETEMLAERLGKNLKGGEVIELVSDLGGGKTTFVRGLAKGFGSEDKVASPTFTVSKVYKAGHRELHHFDFYRLADAGILAHELQDLIGDPEIVLVIEWGKIAHHVLPASRLTLRLKRRGDNDRELIFDAPEELAYLLEGVC